MTKILIHKKWSKVTKVGFLSFCVLFMLLWTNGCKHSNADSTVSKPAEYHYLIIGRQLYKEEGSLRAKYEPLDYRITVFINDNPVCSMKEPTGIFSINEFIKQGENHVRIYTDKPQQIEAAVTATPDFMSQTVKGHVQYDPNENNSLECEFRFSAKVNYTLPIYKPENQLVANEKEVSTNVLNLVEATLTALDKKKYNTAASMLYEGSRIYSPYAFGISSKQIDDNIDMYGTKNPHSEDPDSIKYQKYEPDDYVLKYGKNLILIYRKDYGNVFYKSGFADAPTTIACIDGKYIVWSAMPCL
jgi:hypothetical protein